MECAAALGGQTQKEATNESTGQDDVPLYKVCGLRMKGEETSIKSKQKGAVQWVQSGLKQLKQLWP